MINNNPNPVYVIGSYRSGTSILTWCLGQHPNILPLEETHWIAKQSVDLEYLYYIGSKKKQRSFLGLASITKSKFYRDYGKMIDGYINEQKEKLFKLPPKDEKFKLRRSSSDPKTRWVDGTPENAHYIYGLLRLFPNAKFIHILRDPHYVARSLMHFSSAGARDYAEDEAYYTWIRLVKACLITEMALGPQKVLRVYYDDLVKRPEFMIRSCLDFLNEPFHKDCLLPLEQKINSSIYDQKLVQRQEQIGKTHIAEAVELYDSALNHNQMLPGQSFS